VTGNDSYDPRFLAGVRYFNQRDFFEAHESWEELWVDYQGPLRRFYQGLIQVAVCLHHFGNGNMHGTRKLYTAVSATCKTTDLTRMELTWSDSWPSSRPAASR